MSRKKVKKHSKETKNRFLLLFVGIFLLLSLLLFDPKLFTGGDNAVYAILARSIARGKGYKDLYLPDEQPHTQYPFGFPLLLAPLVLIFGTNVLMLKCLVLLTGVAAFYFMCKICESLFRGKSYIILSMFISIPIFAIYNHWILSEMPFLFFSLGAVYLLMKTSAGRGHFYYLAFMFAIFAFFIRAAGISLILGITVWLLVKGRYKQLAIFIILFLIIFVPWQIRNAGITTSGGYLDQLLAKNPYQMEAGRITLLGLMTRVWDNLVLYAFTILPVSLMPFLKQGSVAVMVGLLFVALTGIGFFWRAKNLTVFEFYFTFGVLVLLGWPKVWSSDRFLLPILPIFLIYAYFGLSWLKEKINFKYMIEVFAGIFVLFNILEILPMVRQAIQDNTAYLKGDLHAGYTADWQRYFELIAWMQHNIPKDRIIMARKPEFVYLLSGHKSFRYPFTTNQEEVARAIARCDFVVLDNFYWTGTSRRYLFPVLQKTPEAYEIVKQTRRPEFYLLRVKGKS
ncbi:hypothetical protein AMJ83_06510 [candidate division WOR_3 bacterium SM23_42]|uniref:Glycosyltransferase RgtA/B/C/D-like domain-containing protein n=1 Tax=candidate division WOR_3 bacterium SM23_42 TaxID=1703779 RepID=A0A0S8FTV4_UNCW3|nr:MAG: hypothetical protein AMJ83_06510 [candidate division WOR_3 bacterium SM23_42]